MLINKPNRTNGITWMRVVYKMDVIAMFHAQEWMNNILMSYIVKEKINSKQKSRMEFWHYQIVVKLSCIL